MSALACHGLTAGYRNLAAARGIDLELSAGSVLALLGPNGAGKTTVLNTIAGLLPRLAGDVLVGGRSLPSGRPRAANRAGVVLVPDDRALFKSLSIVENLRAAARRRSRSVEAVADLFPPLRRRWKVAAGDLSGGEQQMLAVARALVQEPRVLLIDEMSMGLAPVVVEELLPLVRRIADETGAVVVLVEQHVQLALEVADEAMVLVHGETRLRGRARLLLTNTERLETAYFEGNDAVEGEGREAYNI